MRSTTTIKMGLLAAVVWLGPVGAATSVAAELNIGGVDAAGGVIKGIVKFDGKQAKRKPIRMGADAFCDKAHPDDPPRNERFVFGDGDTLQNVFVWVSDAGGGALGKDVPIGEAAVIDQVGCMYVPHVSGVRAGQELKILNSDNTLHNVNCQPRENGGFNEGMPVKGMEISKKFSQGEQGVPLKCDVHPWMSAFVHVVDHPYFAVTQGDGTFEIRGLPDGEYEVHVWHEFNKFKPDQEHAKVSVAGGGEAEVVFTYAPPAKK